MQQFLVPLITLKHVSIFSADSSLRYLSQMSTKCCFINTSKNIQLHLLDQDLLNFSKKAVLGTGLMLWKAQSFIPHFIQATHHSDLIQGYGSRPLDMAIPVLGCSLEGSWSTITLRSDSSESTETWKMVRGEIHRGSPRAFLPGIRITHLLAGGNPLN